MIRNAASLERLYSLDAVILDKTGTLTLGREDVTDVVDCAGADPAAVLSLCASVESLSEHPLSRAVVRYARNKMAPLTTVTGFQALAGMGVRGTVGGREVVVGNAALMHHVGVARDPVEPDAARLRGVYDAAHPRGRKTK